MLQLRGLRRDAEEARVRVDVLVVRREGRKGLSEVRDVGRHVLLDETGVWTWVGSDDEDREEYERGSR